MKALQTALTVVTMGLLGAFLYYFVLSRSVEEEVRETSRKVEEQQTRLSTVDQRISEQAGQLKGHEQSLEVEKKVNDGQEKNILALQERVKALEEKITSLESSATADRTELAKFRQELKILQGSLQKNQEETEALRAQNARRQQWEADMEVRLKNIEKKLGTGKPEP